MIERLQVLKKETPETIEQEYRGLGESIPWSYMTNRALIYGMAIPCISSQNIVVNIFGGFVLLMGEFWSYKFRRHKARAEALIVTASLLEELTSEQYEWNYRHNK